MFVETRRIEATGAHEVYCVDCSKSIGTMTGKILLEAIVRTHERGGVKCPDCRRLSCGVCGIGGVCDDMCTLCKLDAGDSPLVYSSISQQTLRDK